MRHIFFTTALFFAACGSADESNPSEIAAPKTSDAETSQDPNKKVNEVETQLSNGDTYDIDRTIFTHPLLHYVLIHGGGPSYIVEMSNLQKGMIAAGVEKTNIHLIEYPHNESLKEVSNIVAKKIRKITSGLDPLAQIDILAHSLGDFVGLYAIAENQLTKHVRKYIALAGVKWGQNKKPLTCLLGCSDIYDFIVPHKNPRILSFMEKHKAQLDKIEHCSLDSNADRMVTNPRQAGLYPGGRQALIPELGHMDFKKSEAFNHIRTSCYLPRD